MFGESVWDGMTPEQQSIVEAAIRKAIVQAATAYVQGGAKF
jgi:TRAP-type C4-dicarboxylate transport system substrate-binding protein